MPSQLVSSSGCCQPCDSEPVVVNIPGPQGAAGANGTNGTNGVNAFCYTTASFFVPALGASVFVYVTASDFLPESVAGQFFVSVQGLGYMQVTSVDGLRLTLQNPAAGVLSIPNAIPTTLIPAGSLITLAGAVGPQGPAGVAGGASSAGTYIVRTPDASIPSATALNSLSAGYLKTQGSGGFGAVSTVSTVPVGDISGVLPIAKGGTNLSSTPTNGQLLIGNGSGYTLASLTAGSNVTITPGAGTITIAATNPSAFTYETFYLLVGIDVLLTNATANQNPLKNLSPVYPAAGWTTSATVGEYTTQNTGYYEFTVDVLAQGVSSTSDIKIKLLKNGTVVKETHQCGLTASGSADQTAPIILHHIDKSTVAATDVFKVLCDVASSGATKNVYFEHNSSFSIKRIAPL
jgi:hypothetical protein